MAKAMFIEELLGGISIMTPGDVVCNHIVFRADLPHGWVEPMLANKILKLTEQGQHLRV